MIEWRRVMDWRLTQLGKMPNVEISPSSKMQTKDVLESSIKDVIIATGASWRRDGIGRSHWQPIPGIGQPHLYTPDDIMEGNLPSGHVLLFDDEHFYIGGVIAEKLVQTGCTVTMITSESLISAYTRNTLEQAKIQDRLLELGVTMHTQSTLQSIHANYAVFSQALTGQKVELTCDAVVTVVDRLPNDALYQALKPSLVSGLLNSLRVIGDADAPNIIERAVFAGHLAAREFDEPPVDGTPFLIERFDYS